MYVVRKVVRHQDLSIPVAERVDCLECHEWSQKKGELFVQPPTSVLEEMVAVRLHLEDCDERNGALRVVPGSHRFGRLTASESRRARDARGEELGASPPWSSDDHETAVASRILEGDNQQHATRLALRIWTRDVAWKARLASPVL